MTRYLVVTATLLGALVLIAPSAGSKLTAPTRRALIIGINHYNRFAYNPASGREPIDSLSGSMNDAESMRALLVEHFGFDTSHIRLLLDTAATQQHIIAAIKRLVADAEPGDVVVFYYAGHGAQRVNTKSVDPSKLDQTIVPVDANTGVYDIRNKELSGLFGPLVQKGVTLTLIFDSCHSGAIVRGGHEARYTMRWAGRDPRDALDSVSPPAPEDHGALVMAAAESYQSANEGPDDRGVDHGVFTRALVAVLSTAAPNQSATRIFDQVKAVVQGIRPGQEPVLAGTLERRQQSLLGGQAAAEGVTTVPVLRLSQRDERDVELQGGLALGLREDAELIPFGRRPDAAPLRLRVTQVRGLSGSTARVIEGARDSIHAGDLFQVAKWAPPPAAGLHVWMPPATLEASSVPGLVAQLAELRQTPGVEWVEDPTEVPADNTPMVTLQPRDGGWLLEVAARRDRGPAQRLSASSVRSRLLQMKGTTRVFVLLPPSKALVAHLELGNGTPNDLVQLAADPDQTDYLLVGRLRAGHVEYAWMRPYASREAANTSTLPIRTDWVEATPGRAQGPDSSAATALADQALRLAKIRSWLEMKGPADSGGFPYHLALRRSGTSALRTQGPVYEDEVYDLVLVADSAHLKPWLEPRWVYVFAIDSHGESVVLFPPGSELNRLPFNGRWEPQILLGARLDSIVAPCGMDTYLLLSSDSISGTVPKDALEWPGVLQGRTRGGESPLAQLLYANSRATRSTARPSVPVNWSIEQVPILSAANPAKGAHSGCAPQ